MKGDAVFAKRADWGRKVHILGEWTPRGGSVIGTALCNPKTQHRWLIDHDLTQCAAAGYYPLGARQYICKTCTRIWENTQ